MLGTDARNSGSDGDDSGRAMRLVFHLIAAGALFVIPAQFDSGVSVWNLEKQAFVQVAGGVAAYLLAACILEYWRWNRPRVAFFVAPALALSTYGMYAIGLFAGSAYSRSLLIGTAVAGCVLLTLTFFRGRIMAVAIVACAAGLGPMLLRNRDARESPESRPTELLSTAYEWLDMVAYSDKLPSSTRSGGALAPLDDAYLLTLGDGRLFRLRFQRDSDSLEVEPLGAHVPINADDFDANTNDEYLPWFRVADLLVQKTSRGIRLLASHHYWKTDSSCFVVRVSKLETSIDDLRAQVVTDKWSTVFETKPCMAVVRTERMSGFLGLEVGGSMVALDDARILLALGHHGFDGLDSPLIVSQDTAYDMGKTILLDVRTGHTRQYSLGHRNPQGLHLASDGSIWLTEHGPQGGDELNLLADSANYGWPHETYGTQYGTRTWPLSATPGEHEKYRAPVFAWLPSIGVTSVFQSPGRAVPAWRGDLLIGSLRSLSLWRVRVRHGRVVFAEPILIKKRIRDVVEGNDGRIVMLAGLKGIVALRPSRLPDQGQRLFVTQCAGCHTVGQGATQGIGPDLQDIVERRVAGLSGFQYSPALRKLRGKWEEGRLESFLSDPAGFAPGTSMNFKGMSDSLSRVAIIKYLASK